MYHFQTYLNVPKLIASEQIEDEDDIELNVIKDERNSVRNLEFVCEIYGFEKKKVK